MTTPKICQTRVLTGSSPVLLAVSLTICLLAVAIASKSFAQASDAGSVPKASEPQGTPSVSSSDAKPYSPDVYNLLLQQRLRQQPTKPRGQVEADIDEELLTRALLSREATKQGITSDPAVRSAMDAAAANVLSQRLKSADDGIPTRAHVEFARQDALIRAYVANWKKEHPVSDAAIRQEYDAIRASIGKLEYRLSHILLPTESDAQQVIAALTAGAEFESVAKQQSIDPATRARGGDLDWNATPNFPKAFADAMITLRPGDYTKSPVKTQFGWHVIKLVTTRPAMVPEFEAVMENLRTRLQALALDKHFSDLRAKHRQ